MKFRPRECPVCGAEYTPTNGNQRRCQPCREATGSQSRDCTDCGCTFNPTKHTSDRCEGCIMATNPRSVQCPYPWCLDTYVPDHRNPHRCTKGPVREGRLAAVKGAKQRCEDIAGRSDSGVRRPPEADIGKAALIGVKSDSTVRDYMRANISAQLTDDLVAEALSGIPDEYRAK